MIHRTADTPTCLPSSPADPGPATSAPPAAAAGPAASARLELPDQTLELPLIVGTEGEKAVDVRELRARTGYITYDEAYGNTGSCQSQITFIDGERGILRYRGIPIEELARKASFVQTA